MFKKGLLVSTALIAVAWIFPAAAEPVDCRGGANQHLTNLRDANDEFLQNYGQFLVCGSSGGSSASHYSRWMHVAVPVTGNGQTVSKIKVKEALDCCSSQGDSTFYAGIYSNSPSGFPGKLLARGQAKAPGTLAPVIVSIQPTKLKRNKTYWIEESAPPFGSHFPTIVYWGAERRAKSKAYVQTHQRYENSSTHSSSSYTSPWKQQSLGPYVRLK